MGCLNSTGNFSHWFGNIHLSGPCNRSCYFCIGQHMMSLDAYNNLDEWPLKGMGQFILNCLEHNVLDVNLTGTNTDPLLYKHIEKLTDTLREYLPGVRLGIRTNGALISAREKAWRMFDKGSISIPTFDPAIYKKIMGSGYPPQLEAIEEASDIGMDLKVNIVLCPENIGQHLHDTIIHVLDRSAIKKINIREPYGQPHIGDPLAADGFVAQDTLLGMPVYKFADMEVTYWDVHYVEVESVNLYASGKVSVDYPITRGHDDVAGKVIEQSHWKKSGRQVEQWISAK